MDRLKLLQGPTRASRARTAAARPQARQTRREREEARKKNIIVTKSYNSLHPIRQDDSQRIIEFDFASFPSASYRVSFDDLLEALCCQETLPAKLPYLDALQQSLVDALHLLHAHNISFPLSTSQVEFSRRCGEEWRDISFLKLFLPFNKSACWASDSLPPSWKADQLACAESIFFVPQLLIRLVTAPKPTVLDPASQQALAIHLKENPTFQHDKYCLDIHPLTAGLAHQIAYCLVMRDMAEKSREVLESFFGGPMPLPEPGTPPDIIYRTFSDLRACAIKSEKCRGGSDGIGLELGPELLVASPKMVTRFVCCRAEVALVLGEPDKREWWLAAMDLYDAFLSSQGPSSSLERVCAFDLNHYRD